jgi:hypothetical protein
VKEECNGEMMCCGIVALASCGLVMTDDVANVDCPGSDNTNIRGYP